MTNCKTIFLMLGAIQMVLVKPLEATPSNKTLIAKSDLIHFYEKAINHLSEKYCVKFKNISDQILNDAHVKESSTPVMLGFKRNMTHYQEIYPLYTRLGLHKPLLSYFTQKTIKYYYQNDQDSQYILKLLKSHNYNEILDQFERDFMKFASAEFLEKFDHFKNLIPQNETKEWQQLLKWGKDLKDCKSYECFYKSFIHFDKIILTAKEQLFAYINIQLRNLGLFYGNGTYVITKAVLKSPKISQLSPNVLENLKNNLKHFIQEYENNRNMTNFNKIFEYLYRLVLSEFLNNENMPAEDAKLLSEIFNEKGYAEFEKSYLNKFKDFLDIELNKKINIYKAQLSEKEFDQEQKFIERFNHIKELNSFEEKKMALTKIMNEYYGMTQ